MRSSCQEQNAISSLFRRRDAATIVASSALFSVNDALTHSALLVQGFPSNNVVDEDFVVHIPFPLVSSAATNGGDGDDRADVIKNNPFDKHPAVQLLVQALQLNKMCGYISLINSHQVLSDNVESDWTLFDCNFGIPLFDRSLNREVCEMIIRNHLCSSAK